jgi:hypothetical protein
VKFSGETRRIAGSFYDGGVSAGAEAPSRGFSATVHRQGACWQSQRSSVLSPACLQCSLQYFPYGPLGSTMH